MKRILINATQNEEIRVALCKGNHLYDFDLENRTREQKKSNIYKGHVTRVEPSLEAVFVEYGSQRQGFLPIREISAEYLSGNPRDENIKKLIKEGDELIVQVEKEERGNKGAALSTYVSLAGRYLVLMPNNPKGGGISRQISGKLREDMKRMLGNLDLPKGMSVIVRTAGIGKTQEDLQHDLNHLLNIWQAIQEQNQKYPSPRLVHQEAGVVTRAVRDYLRDDISEIWIDNENAYIEAAGFIDAVMPKQAEKLRKYTDYEPMFSRFNIEKQIETAYQREVRLPSGGSIVIDQTEALVSIDINSAKSTKGSDVAETAYHTNLEAADEIARQLRLRDMGGLIVIDFIDMNDNKHQKEVEKRLVDATKYDRARVQFGDISKFGLMEMSRQRLRPSLEESTGYICPRCHGNGMIRDLRSLSLSIMRQIEQIALKERQGEVQAEVPTDIAAFLLNEKRDSLVYLEQDSGTRITILPHAHLESPNFKLHFNRDGFAPSSYERITDTQQQEHSDLGYNVDWQTADSVRPEQQPTRQPRQVADNGSNKNSQATPRASSQQQNTTSHSNDHRSNANTNASNATTRAPQLQTQSRTQSQNAPTVATTAAPVASQNNNATAAQPQAVAWLSNLFAQAPQASTTPKVSSRDAAEAIEALVNTGAQSLGSFGQIDSSALDANAQAAAAPQTASNQQNTEQQPNTNRQQAANSNTDDSNDAEDRRRRKPRKSRPSKTRQRKEQSDESNGNAASNNVDDSRSTGTDDKQADSQDKRQHDNRRTNDRNRNNRQDSGRNGHDNSNTEHNDAARKDANTIDEQTRAKRKSNSQRSSRGKIERGETLSANNEHSNKETSNGNGKSQSSARRNQDPNEVVLQVNEASTELKSPEVVHLSLDDSKSVAATRQAPEKQSAEKAINEADKQKASQEDSTAKNADKQEAVEQITDSQAAKNRRDSVDSSQKTSTQTVTADAAKSDNPASGDAVVAAAKTDETKLSSTDDKVQKSDANSVDERNVEATKPAADEQSTSKSRSAVKTSGKDDDVAPTEKAQKTGSNVDFNTDDTDSSNQAAFELDHQALFAKRYVTAEKFGQASNDPRVVRRQHAQASTTTASDNQPPVVNEQRAVNAPAIRGTVGEFIRATLPEAPARLAAEGVINCFNAAIALHLEQANAVNEKVDSNNESKVETGEAAKQDFDFSNYGYEPLAADYLASFEAMTQAVSQFAAAQGKTAVEPRPISKRASNDPRGQHPDYQEPAATTVAEAPKNGSLAADSDVDVDAQNVDATALANQSQTDDVSADSEELLKVEQVLEAENAEQPEVNAVAADNVEVADTEAKDTDSDVEQSETEQASEPTEQLSEQATKEEIQAAKSKTTIASYKNMIENVAEQLLPQKGMFNLTTPKVPKARTRKPKAEHKKPTQAEKSENDDSDSES